MTNGALTNVQHFDSKAEVEEYIRSQPTSKLPIASFFQPGFYMSNIKNMARAGQDGVKTLYLPWDPVKTRVAMLDAARDTGNYVAGLLLAPEEQINRVAVHGISEWYVQFC